MKKLTKKKEAELAQRFFDAVWYQMEDISDWTLDSLCEDGEDWCRYGVAQLLEKFNNGTILEVIRLGFRQKYGVPFNHAKTIDEVMKEQK